MSRVESNSNPWVSYLGPVRDTEKKIAHRKLPRFVTDETFARILSTTFVPEVQGLNLENFFKTSALKAELELFSLGLNAEEFLSGINQTRSIDSIELKKALNEIFKPEVDLQELSDDEKLALANANSEKLRSLFSYSDKAGYSDKFYAAVPKISSMLGKEERSILMINLFNDSFENQNELDFEIYRSIKLMSGICRYRLREQKVEDAVLSMLKVDLMLKLALIKDEDLSLEKLAALSELAEQEGDDTLQNLTDAVITTIGLTKEQKDELNDSIERETLYNYYVSS